jgi:hypothetical protein
VNNITLADFSFASVDGTYNNRFEIVYTSAPLVVANPNFDANSIIIYKQYELLHIKAGTTTMKSAKIFDVPGRLIFEQSGINAITTTLNDLKAAQ